MNARTRRPGSIRTRISGGFFLLLFLVFAVLAIGFNLVVDAYINTQAERQLGAAISNVSSEVLDNPNRGNRQSMTFQGFPGVMQQINNIARRATFFTQVKALVIDEELSRLVYPTEVNAPDSMYDANIADLDLDEKQAVFEAIERSAITLSDGQMSRFDDEGRTYFVEALPLFVDSDASGEEGSEYRLILYLDMTDITSLARSLNMVLLAIITATAVLGAALAVYMSGRITEPIRRLNDFAEALGRSDFSRRELMFHDRELIELGDAMNQAAEHLEKYDKEQKTFFQNASHELRTPLMSIKGYAEGIKVGVFDDNTEAADVIIGETDQLASMVEDLLYLSRVDNITRSDEISCLDARELLSNCGESLRGVALHEGTRIEYDFPEEAVMIDASERALSRAFENIIANGLRYAKSAVSIRCEAKDGFARVTISDDGPGIAPEDREHIFDRFYKGRGGKHGIGLSIAKVVISQHHGEIRADSEGSGACFAVELPLNQ